VSSNVAAIPAIGLDRQLVRQRGLTGLVYHVEGAVDAVHSDCVETPIEVLQYASK